MALFKKLSPHEAYAQRLKDAGLDHTAIGGAWLQNANNSLTKALTVTIPYKETGYFAADKIQTAALRFEAKRGQKLHIALNKKPEFGFAIYMDLLQENAGNESKIVASADTAGVNFSYEISQAGYYILRLQPELLRGGEYTLTITAGPSLNFPVSSSGKPHIGSFWGDSRDAGGRRHEGVDIFAPKGTPALAAADGTVTRVTENKLGGKVVFMHPDNENYTLYYAHLGKQLVQDGETIHAGDTVGLIDNTGNAKNTPSHLHFGIYTFGQGAVDPLPFVNREIKTPKPINAPLELLNATAHTTTKNNKLYTEPNETSLVKEILPVNTIINIEAATDSWYKAVLPNGLQGFISRHNVSTANTIKKYVAKQAQPLLDAPNVQSAARKTIILEGSRVNVKGIYKNYYLVTDEQNNAGWIEAER
ncbi:M23 family metallopeptidase [Mucilaginibacter robiniae]|uniref:M23 family metallopeptidase n=1 Tax=Mucilaginibacter robiniae TaxID=2728022 RepID=A0A7L5E0X7_9SPHI|nr:M23 family metallopeptidase [Mucilaginibacter robiniae]QJD94473.1 M23 family metallopeptidase [Mucilaginibacter robiniae]